MRFVPVLPNLTQAWDTAGTAYSGPSWLYCRAEFSYQAALGVTLPPYFARREPTERRRLRAVGREREKRTIVMTYRIATAWPRGRAPDRHFGRHAGGGACGSARAGPATTA